MIDAVVANGGSRAFSLRRESSSGSASYTELRAAVHAPRQSVTPLAAWERAFASGVTPVWQRRSRCQQSPGPRTVGFTASVKSWAGLGAF
jgi:hypothetical protein